MIRRQQNAKTAHRKGFTTSPTREIDETLNGGKMTRSAEIVTARHPAKRDRRKAQPLLQSGLEHTIPSTRRRKLEADRNKSTAEPAESAKGGGQGGWADPRPAHNSARLGHRIKMDARTTRGKSSRAIDQQKRDAQQAFFRRQQRPRGISTTPAAAPHAAPKRTTDGHAASEKLSLVSSGNAPLRQQKKLRAGSCPRRKWPGRVAQPASGPVNSDLSHARFGHHTGVRRPEFHRAPFCKRNRRKSNRRITWPLDDTAFPERDSWPSPAKRGHQAGVYVQYTLPTLSSPAGITAPVQYPPPIPLPQG